MISPFSVPVSRMTTEKTSCKKRNGGLDNSFSVSGGFLTNLPSESWVLLMTVGLIAVIFIDNFHKLITIKTLKLQRRFTFQQSSNLQLIILHYFMLNNHKCEPVVLNKEPLDIGRET